MSRILQRYGYKPCLFGVFLCWNMKLSAHSANSIWGLFPYRSCLASARDRCISSLTEQDLQVTTQSSVVTWAAVERRQKADSPWVPPSSDIPHRLWGAGEEDSETPVAFVLPHSLAGDDIPAGPFMLARCRAGLRCAHHNRDTSASF